MSDTLPARWVGNNADHHIEMARLRIRVHQAARGYHPSGIGGYDDRRTGPYRWTVSIVGADNKPIPIATSQTTGHPTPKEARKVALDAARVVLLEMTQDCDWIARGEGDV